MGSTWHEHGSTANDYCLCVLPFWHRDQDTVKALKAAVASEELFKSQKNKSLPQMVKHGGSKDDIEASMDKRGDHGRLI